MKKKPIKTAKCSTKKYHGFCCCGMSQARTETIQAIREWAKRQTWAEIETQVAMKNLLAFLDDLEQTKEEKK